VSFTAGEQDQLCVRRVRVSSHIVVCFLLIFLNHIRQRMMDGQAGGK